MRHFSGYAISLLSVAVLSSAAPAHAQTSFDAMANDTCQQAVEQQIKTKQSSASNIGYDRSKTAQAEFVTSVKGNGHFDGDHGAVKFSYTCNYDIRSGDASGVQLHMNGDTASN